MASLVGRIGRRCLGGAMMTHRRPPGVMAGVVPSMTAGVVPRVVPGGGRPGMVARSAVPHLSGGEAGCRQAKQDPGEREGGEILAHAFSFPSSVAARPIRAGLSRPGTFQSARGRARDVPHGRTCFPMMIVGTI